jgi:hypothetical protein
MHLLPWLEVDSDGSTMDFSTSRYSSISGINPNRVRGSRDGCSLHSGHGSKSSDSYLFFTGIFVIITIFNNIIQVQVQVEFK